MFDTMRFIVLPFQGIVGCARLVVDNESQSLIINTSIISNFGRKVKNFFTLYVVFF